MATTQTAKKQVAKKADSQPEQKDGGGHTVKDMIEDLKPAMQRALPGGMSAEQFAQRAWLTVRDNPQLLNCEPSSLLGALMTAARLGLEPGPLGEVYLIPRRDNKRKTVECQFLLGYRGIIRLARNTGVMERISAHEVYTNDEFDYAYGIDERLHHRPAEGDRGKFRGAYCIAKYVGGGHDFVFLPENEIEKRRARSAAADSGPWKTDYDAMARKSAVRALEPYLPKSAEMAQAFAADGTSPLLHEGGLVDIQPVQDIEPDDGELGAGQPPDDTDPETGETSPPPDGDAGDGGTGADQGASADDDAAQQELGGEQS